MVPQFVLPLSVIGFSAVDVGPVNVGALLAIVTLVMLAPVLFCRTIVENDVLSISCLAVLLLRVDLSKTRGVDVRTLTLSRGGVSVIQLVDLCIMFRRFGRDDVRALDLWMTNCLLGRRREQWLSVLGAPTRRGVALPGTSPTEPPRFSKRPVRSGDR